MVIEVAPPKEQSEVYFIHVRKTGGGSMKIALRPYLESHGITLWPHAKTLRHVPAGAKAILGVREPVSRFISGFNSRLRRGLPKKHNPWTAEESLAFNRFSTPNDLAEALVSDDQEVLSEARRAMDSIAHVRHRYVDTFGSSEYLAARSKGILMIVHQPDMRHDFDALKRLLGLPQSAKLTDDAVQAHHTPAGFSTQLTDRGRSAIEQWYADDVAIYTTAMAIRRQILAGIPHV